MNNQPVKLMIIIIDRSKGKKVTNLLNNLGISYNVTTLGYGTAPTEIMSVFGFGETEKDVVMCVAESGRIKEIFDSFDSELKMNKPNEGIAFTIPITSVSELNLTYMLSKEE